MITIQIGGKTYQIIDLKGRIKSTIEEWISAGYLEEVKENKEPTVHIPNDGKKYMINGELYNPQANSILEKLRKELEKMKTENTDTSDEYTQGVLNTCGYLLDLLSSLETKEEPVPPTDKGREQYLADHPEELARQPQEDIELLSFDYEKLEENVRDVEALCDYLGVTKKEDRERMKDIFIKPTFSTSYTKYSFIKPQ